VGEFRKGDKTSVSLADFAAQALLVAAIHHNFPGDTIVGKEETSILRSDPKIADRVWELVSTIHLENEDCEKLLRSPVSLSDMLHYIELGGTSYGGPKGRVWMIDPVDGTKGFLKGGQYVVYATLLIDGVETVAAFGCPHVNLESGKISEQDTDKTGNGYLISAVRGKGAQVRPLSRGALLESKAIEKNKAIHDLSTIRFAENCITTSPQFSDRHKIAEKLGAPWNPIHMYSTQLRYIALALGACDVVLRTPKPADSAAHAWDHAGGVMVYEEAGGKGTDLNGKDLVFTAGRDLTKNFGLIAAPASIHSQVVAATKAVFRSCPEYAGVVDSGT
jgi:3'(2'), 5'-bisphosphate nucleotidase